MKTVFKYPLDSKSEQIVNLPTGAEVLSVQFQESLGVFCLWALVDDSLEEGPRKIRMYGTGHEIAEPAEHLGFISTVQRGYWVWHFFESFT